MNHDPTAGQSIQVVRRMRAMLEQLHDEVPEPRRGAVAEELDRPDATVRQVFAQHEATGGRPAAETALRGHG